jgi:hypothetical protein
MNVAIEPKAKRRVSGWAFVGPALAAMVIGYFAVGPASLIVAVVVFAVVVLLAWAGPRFNSRVYDRSPSLSAGFAASAIVDHVAGRMGLESGELTWTPRRQNSGRSVIQFSLSTVSRATLRPLPGIPTSCRLRCEMHDGASVEMTVFGTCNRLAQALRTS